MSLRDAAAVGLRGQAACEAERCRAAGNLLWWWSPARNVGRRVTHRHVPAHAAATVGADKGEQQIHPALSPVAFSQPQRRGLPHFIYVRPPVLFPILARFPHTRLAFAAFLCDTKQIGRTHGRTVQWQFPLHVQNVHLGSSSMKSSCTRAEGRKHSAAL